MRYWLIFLTTLLLLGTSASALAFAPADYRGIWYDRARDGHGLDVHTAGTTIFAVFYTYDDIGEPIWYTAQATLGDTFAAPIRRFTRASNGVVGAGVVVGSLDMTLDATAASAGCNDGVARPGSRLAQLSIAIGAERHQWCIEPITARDARAEASLGGVWWAGPAENGWGFGLTLLPSAQGNRLVSLLYHYDASGVPRWSIADATSATLEFVQRAAYPLGYCRSCTPRPLLFRDGGAMNLTLSTPRGELDLGNRAIIDLRYPGPNGGRWLRDIPIGLLSSADLPTTSAATREGLVVARTDANDASMRIFEGIAFAQPPLGALRWRAPLAPPPRFAVLRNPGMRAACPQQAGQGFFGAVPPVLAEDCLYLNVWSRAQAGDAPKPVMVWIHGGGLVQGGASQTTSEGVPAYDGTTLANRDVVFVSINYRLGALGFVVLDELLDENPAQPGGGNYGFLDQVAALDWVRKNIAAFGGDPARVTIFGESAGGVSVCAHMASPLSAGLFHGAIMQSGNCLNSLPNLRTANGNLPPATAQGERLKARLGCTAGNVAVCLRGKTSDEIVLAAQGSTSFAGTGEQYGFVIDAHAFSRAPGAAVRGGSAHRVPFVIGVNEDEATTLLPASEKPTTLAGYEALVRSRLPTIAGQVLALYPGSAYTPVWRGWAAIVSDTRFICAAARAARDHAANGNPAYAYYFTHVLRTPTLEPLGAFHAIEIPFLFSEMLNYGAAEATLATRMQSLWTSFAQDGIADASGVATWPAHPAFGALGLELNGAGISPRVDYRRNYCEFWANYVAL